jgi:hypothetical protein
MKYINKFSTNADYKAFTEGGGYVTPNVCYVEESNGIVMKPYNESVLITFYISNVECFAEKGMTWKQWFNSEYYSPFYANAWYITEDSFTTLTQVNITDVIIENNIYTLPKHGGGDND